MASDLERRIGLLQRGDHLCLIYDSAAEQTAALVSFFKTGLAAGERCLFLGSVPGGRRLERALSADGVALGAEIDRGAVVLLTGREEWLPGPFHLGETLDLLRRTEQQALDDGFSGLRVAWEMARLVQDEQDAPDPARLIEHEAQLNRFLSGSRTSLLCQYSRARTSAELMHGVLRTHPLALLGEQLCPNPYYEPPGLVLGTRPEEQVDWMITNLLQARAGEQRLEDATRRLAQKGAALERADRAKEDLLAMLAHELRNPLGTVSNALQVLRLKGEGDDTWKRAIDAAERQVHHQAILIDELLEASRVTRGEVELNCERLDLSQVVQETVEGYRETLTRAGLSLEIQLPEGELPIRGDRLRLSQAIANLLHNAAKFTGPGGRIRVRARRAGRPEVGEVGGIAEVADIAEVSVRDSGQGISPEILPHVFEVFTQADHSLDRSQGGLGVGLAVVKGLIEMHGGEVEASSEGEDHGTELTLRLPLVPGRTDRAGNASRAASAPGATEARRILVVEDNPDHAATMRDFLELSGHEVELANSGTDGVEVARHFHPEVVLCDLGLPGMNGFEVAAEMRRDPSLAEAQLIAVTGYGAEEDRRRAREAGFDLHLTKPVDPAQLRRILQSPMPAYERAHAPAHAGSSA